MRRDLRANQTEAAEDPLWQIIMGCEQMVSTLYQNVLVLPSFKRPPPDWSSQPETRLAPVKTYGTPSPVTRTIGVWGGAHKRTTPSLICRMKVKVCRHAISA